MDDSRRHQNPVFCTMVMLALMVMGAVSYFRLPIDAMPGVNLPFAFTVIAVPWRQSAGGRGCFRDQADRKRIEYDRRSQEKITSRSREGKPRVW